VNEEAPFYFGESMGSGVYARAARRRGDDVRAMFSLEMLGCYSDAPCSQSYPPLLKYFYPSRGNFIAFVSNLRSHRVLRAAVAAFRASTRFPCEHAALPSWVPGVGWSDQLSFWRAGYRAIMVTDTAFHRYAHYHRPTDTPDRLDYDRLAEVTRGLAGAFGRLASGPLP
jgi:pimeloyl-ACP methyl ester carboxylesterase